MWVHSLLDWNRESFARNQRFGAVTQHLALFAHPTLGLGHRPEVAICGAHHERCGDCEDGVEVEWQ